MYGRMIINDIKTNKLVSAATCIFMAVTAMLLGLSILLYLSLGDLLDGRIKGELDLEKNTRSDSRDREQKVIRWLTEMGW